MTIYSHKVFYGSFILCISSQDYTLCKKKVYYIFMHVLWKINI